MTRACLPTLRRLLTIGLLSVTVLASMPVKAAEQWLYKVQPGDNLWNFSKEHLTSMRFMRRLQTMNNVANPRRLPPGSTLKVPMDWLKVRPVPVLVDNADGTVSATNLLGKPVDVAAGTKLLIGTTIRTGEDGNATLKFADTSLLTMRSNAELTLDAMSAYGSTGMVDSRLRLARGRIGATVNKAKGPGSRFEITTPAAVAAVRGTVERVATDGQSMLTEVTEGEVLVASNAGNTLVPEGFGTRTERGRAPEPPRALLAAPDLSGFDGLVDRLPPRISWPAVDGAARYRIQVSSTNDFKTLTLDTLSEAPALRGIDLADGDYFLRLRAIAADGLEGLDANTPFTVNARPEPPFARAPQPDETIRDNWAALTWTQPENAQAYQVQLARDEAFTDLIDNAEISETEFTTANEVVFGQYYWRVATRDGTGETGPFGDPQMFKLKPTPAQPITEPPAIGENEMAFRWSKGEPGQTYRFQLSEDSDFETLINESRVDDPTITIAKPEWGTYYMRVATIDTDGYEGPFSTAQKIEVPYEGLLHWAIPPAIGLLFLVL